MNVRNDNSIDKSNHSLRYPLASPPVQANPQLGYVSQSNDIQTTAAIATVLKISWKVVSTVISLIHKKRAQQELVANILGQVQDLLWEFGNRFWEDMMDAVEVLIEKKLAERVRRDALLRLEGMNDTITRYKEAAENWQEDKSNSRLMEEVRTQFRATETYITGSMSFFRDPGYEINLLPVYLQAADLHLLLLRDVLLFGREWGMSPAAVEDYYSGRLGLKELTASYTDYLINSYNLGLQDAFRRTADLSDRQRYPWITGNPNLYQPVEDWNIFNEYRTEMTTFALDLIAVWPVYDVYTYPEGASIQLTRLLYTDARGSQYPGGNFSRQEVENSIVKPPSLYGDLWDIDFYRANNLPNESLFRQYAGYKLKVLPSAYYGAPLIEYPLRGYTYDWNNVGIAPTRVPVTAPNGEPIEIIYDRNKHGLACYTFQFTYNEGYTRTVGQAPPNDQFESSAWPGILPEDMEQKLVWIGGVVNTSYRSIQCFGFGWAYRNVTLYNTLDPYTNNQIPAVKSYMLDNNGVVIKGTGATGGDLVSLPSGNGGCRMQVQVSSEPKNYLIRLRYASTGASTVNIAVRNFYGAQEHDQSFQIPSTYTGVNLNYKAFGYLDTLVFATQPRNVFFNIEIKNIGGNTIILDKIEFIPIQGSLEEYQAQEALEKAEKAVNTLFTNNAKQMLQLNVTDYQVDQAARLVECMSDEIYPKEKMCLLDHVKCAKRLSQVRNLLNHGDFESPDWSGADGWSTSN
ncbi:hypothetical protein FOA24_35255, partial [Bacillus thuringiensis]|uniref:insecticidal delta-endotoxin Cry8Ea1 family protein n=1 Tax=Bacillus thuringiensis TaxID=1428 RepID=UPI003338AD85